MNTQRGILFDLDGTLLDTAPDLAKAANCLYQAHGKNSIEFESLRLLAGEGSPKFIEHGFGKLDELKDYAALRKEYLDYYFQTQYTTSIFFPGIETLLQELNTRELPWGIVTNKSTDLTTALFPKFPLLETAKVIVCADTLEKAKPHPEPLWYACEKLNVSPNHSVFIGDHERDVQAAKAAGLTAIAALYGYIPSMEIAKTWQADKYISTVEELSKLLL